MGLLGMSFRERLAGIFNRKTPSRKDAEDDDSDTASARLLEGPFRGLKKVRPWPFFRRLAAGAKKKLLFVASLMTNLDELLEAKLRPWLETVGGDLACGYHKLAGKAGAKHRGAWFRLGDKMVGWGVDLKQKSRKNGSKQSKKKKSNKELCRQQCEKAERAATTAALKAGEARQALYEVLRLMEM
ncbi:hypothetical protein LQW54_009413 [Pestalotiopsis sp. IQ-011]